MALTSDQASGIADRTVSGALIWLVSFVLAKVAALGYLAASDVPQLSVVVIILASAGWGYWINRPMAIVKSAAALPGTTVVTTPDLATATPDQANIVSNLKNKVIDTATQKIVNPIPPLKAGA